MSTDPKSASVLVVEDNLNNYLLITRLLAYLGVKNCEWKASGWQVLPLTRARPGRSLPAEVQERITEQSSS